jgi:hypothetical protein
MARRGDPLQPAYSGGTRCSVGSASYAIEVCDRISGIVSEKYRLLGKADDIADLRVPRYGTELEKELVTQGQGFDIVLRQWSGERVHVFLSFPRPRNTGQGWRCTFRYYPPPAMQEALMNEAERAENAQAKKDL